TEELVRDHLAGLTEPDTVDQVRMAAETKANSLLGKRLSLESQINPAKQALQQAEEACQVFLMLPVLRRAPSTPELAEAEATTLEGEAKLHQSNAQQAQMRVSEATQAIEQLHHRARDIERHIDRLKTLRDDYGDLLMTGLGPLQGNVSATLEESM